MALTSVSELQTLIHEHITRTPRLPLIPKTLQDGAFSDAIWPA